MEVNINNYEMEIDDNSFKPKLKINLDITLPMELTMDNDIDELYNYVGKNIIEGFKEYKEHKK